MYFNPQDLISELIACALRTECAISIILKPHITCCLYGSISFASFNIPSFSFIPCDVKICVKPSTSTPKDGPSAGCAFTSAFISRILNKGIRNDIALTGEIELTGRITKIGGLNFKLIGAKKACVKLVFIPKDNENDLEEIKQKYPKLIDDTFEVKIFEYIDEIIDIILV